MSRESCIIVIDRIVVDGFGLDTEQREAFRGRLIRELERRFAETWTGDLASRREGAMQTVPAEVDANPQPADIATHVASKIVEGLRG